MRVDTYEMCGPDYDELQEQAKADAEKLCYVDGKKLPYLIRVTQTNDEDWRLTIKVFDKNIHLDCFLLSERTLLTDN